jgi:hypothetical protein
MPALSRRVLGCLVLVGVLSPMIAGEQRAAAPRRAAAPPNIVIM